MLDEKHELHNRSMHISGTFSEKQDIDEKKQNIETHLSSHQQKQFEKTAAAFGKQTVFGRSDVIRVLGITPSPASALIRKLLVADKIEAVAGHGKGKYVVK